MVCRGLPGELAGALCTVVRMCRLLLAPLILVACASATPGASDAGGSPGPDAPLGWPDAGDAPPDARAAPPDGALQADATVELVDASPTAVDAAAPSTHGFITTRTTLHSLDLKTS